MILYHLDKWKYRKVWPPEGTLHAEGRWNRAGQWIIYCSPTIALAKLEILANESQLPLKRICMTIKLPDTCEVFNIKPAYLPKNWMSMPYSKNLNKITELFLESGKLLMAVPSAQSYREYNYLLNVRHPKFHAKVNLVDVQPEPFDKRLCD
ncbi:MAG: RES domain-containing protein [Bacteroidetes bacterium]|nr:MAG: RES domain-containing protein [Bacteroidota bacterium]